MIITDKEAGILGDIAKQIAAECVAKGITEPTPEQISQMFVARCQRNIQICDEYLNGAKWAETVTKGMAIEVYHDARKQSDMTRFIDSMREADRLRDIRQAAQALDERYRVNI